jgi:hypothetical protein
MIVFLCCPDDQPNEGVAQWFLAQQLQGEVARIRRVKDADLKPAVRTGVELCG